MSDRELFISELRNLLQKYQVEVGDSVGGSFFWREDWEPDVIHPIELEAGNG